MGICKKLGQFLQMPVEFKIKSLYNNDLILNVAAESKVNF
ncbi:hypothetical protein TREVI0001_0649 [Treponema vincentii ATCC 35580]|uniref:Uncharacterized protein n=1 Tax=Treponema vincentii ATCC 35580 TaxID=596324 RepID=C8PMN4_9SPIR|nr:hypothetical protein TREVI0001_0649 [Treponema vincentii ATCC 35580]